MALLLHYTGQDYISRGLLNTELTPGSTSAIVGGCKTGKGFAFDGTANSALSCDLALNNTLFSVSTWFKITADLADTDRNVIFSTNPSVNNKIILDVAYTGRKLRLVVFAGTSFFILEYGAISLNTWYHVVGTVNDTTKTMSIYVNGVLINYMSYTGTLNYSTAFKIGWREGTSQYFNGHICNLKVYNHVLSQKEINEDYKSLMLHYKLDKPITTQVFDHSGFNRHIQVIENTTTNSTTEKRVYGGSLNNNGTQSLYGSLNLSELNGINEISVACRFRIVTSDTTHCYFSSRTTVGSGLSIIQLYAASRGFYIYMAGRNSFTLPYTLVTGTWYDLVAVKSTTDVKLYINGSLINIVSNANSISNMGQLYASISRSIADDNLPLSNTLNGNVQDIRFYAKALTQADVTELYKTRQEIDNLANGYCYELVEGQSEVEMKANGQLYCDEVIENDDGTFSINQNKTIKTKEIKEV
jgi:hypothetical protein